MRHKKETILIVAAIALVAASGLLLYRTFGNKPVAIIQPKVTSEDIIIRNEADRLDVAIMNAMKKLGDEGTLGALANNPQFIGLSMESIKSTPIGATGRDNPFLPVQRPGINPGIKPKNL